MIKQVHQLLKEVGPGKMSSLAYDTAWVARLGEIDSELSNKALNWLCENQLSDGSWGAEIPINYYDRVISTLAALIALTYRGRRVQNHSQFEKGLLALEKITNSATTKLTTNPNGSTVGFEMIVPTLVAEAEKLGIIKQQKERLLGRLSRMRSEKLSKIKGEMINRYVTMAFSTEMAGLDGQHMLDIPNLQEENGSVGHSPSATAYYSIYVNNNDQNALNYLKGVVSEEGGVQDLYPFDIYERAWVMWNLTLYNNWDEDIIQYFRPHLDYLYSAWKSSEGMSFSKGYTVPDGDNTIISYDLLKHYGYDVDIDSVLSFEEEDHFRCYKLEVGVSPSVNIHALLALHKAGYELNHPKVQKILRFLKKAKGSNKYWIDKWHSSPFYTTAHFIIATCEYDYKLAQSSTQWIIDSQRENGAWGFYTPTAEETAYCLQALAIWYQKSGRVSKDVIYQGQRWLRQHLDIPAYPLWIGKGLYSADNVVNSSILSALLLVESL